VASTYLSIPVHIVFSTKQRAPLIGDAWRADLHAYIGGVARGLQAVPLAIGGVADHVHLLVGFPATKTVSEFVRELKKATHEWASRHRSDFAWQRGYAAFGVSNSDCQMVKKYIANQEEHHRELSSAEELRRLLVEHGVEFDERFFE
jgi:REP element-mobilizing transposase RayT